MVAEFLRHSHLFVVFFLEGGRGARVFFCRLPTRMMCSRDLTLLRLGAALRASVCFDTYDRNYSLLKKNLQVGNRTKNHPFLIEWNMDRYLVTEIDYRRNCNRAYNGWPIGNRPTTDCNGAGLKYTVKALKTFRNFVRCECNPETTPTSCALIYLSYIVNNVMFVSIV